ncbi:MAG TPA: sigma-70 family RNA polymerase sigma factor [Lachnospiraceae bacterium]|nr:sigma-70 family RNA polymerase sigma factor [Lachnospiraceae bacterium]
MEQRDLAKIYEENAMAVYKYLLCLTNNSDISEELTQETFYQAAKSIGKFRGESKVSVWLCAIAKRLWYRELEKRKRRAAVPIEEAEGQLISTQDVEEDYLLNVEKVELFRMLHDLDAQTREVMYLRLTGELSFAEIGEILGKTENWARVTFYRGKQKLLQTRKGE